MPPEPVWAIRVCGSPWSFIASCHDSAPNFPGPMSMSITVMQDISPVAMPILDGGALAPNHSSILFGSRVASFNPRCTRGCFPASAHAVVPQEQEPDSSTVWTGKMLKPADTYVCAHCKTVSLNDMVLSPTCYV